MSSRVSAQRRAVAFVLMLSVAGLAHAARPIVSLSAQSGKVTVGEPAALSWASSGALRCRAGGD